MPKLPVISGEKAVRAFKRLGYVPVRQRGSHVRLHHPTDSTRRPLTVPIHHRDLGPGLIRKLCRDAGLNPRELSELL